MNVLYQTARRYLPQRLKRWMKQFLHRGTAKPTAQVSPTLSSVEDALRIWSGESPLAYALQRVFHPDRCAPRASVIVLTHNNLSLTRLCLESIYCNTNTEYPHFELIIIDNNSQDGTREYLEGLTRILPNLRVIFNAHNEGFARATNQGMMQSRGDYIVLLNNDTVVCRGWLSRLIDYLEKDSKVGMVGPVTNSTGNEQMIPASYRSLEELGAFARQRSITHKGQSFEIEMLAMFCVVIPRRVIDQVGLLDEHFELGTFEDDDFCYRVKSLGYKLICAEDVFVHHFGKATMGELGDEAYLELFERNRKKFERKWGVRWRPHRLRL